MAQLQPSLSLVNGKSKANNLDARQNQSAVPTAAGSDHVGPDTELKRIHNIFKELLAGQKVLNPRSAAHSILTANHPNHYIVDLFPRDFDLQDFAAAGHASLEVQYTDSCIDVGRSYKAPYGGRTYGSQAKIEEDVHWARAKYTWQNHEFLVYFVSWTMEYNQEVDWYFLLDPKTSEQAGQPKSEHIDKLLLAVGQYAEESHEDIFVFEDTWTYRDKDMYRAIQDTHWDDVIIDPSMKNAIMEDIISFFEPATKELYARYSVPYKRGIILHGSPGNGKTITIKALINHLQSLAVPIPTLYVKSMKDKCKGDQESLKELFKNARSRAPLLLVLEDLDSLVHGEVRSHFLNEIDGLKPMDGILILGSTNHLSKIDSAISSRPSRFDRKYAFELPDRTGRERYAQHWRSKLAEADDLDFAEELCGVVADLTPGFSFAYLKELFISSLLQVSRQTLKKEDIVVSLPAHGAPSSISDAAVSSEGQDEHIVDGDKKDKDKSHKANHIEMPSITIPESLKTNTFFAILHKQACLLIKDMNDAASKEDENKDDEKKAKKDEQKEDKDHSCSSC